MCEEGVVSESPSVLVHESGSPPVEGYRAFLMEDRGEVGRQGEGQAKSLDQPEQE